MPPRAGGACGTRNRLIDELDQLGWSPRIFRHRQAPLFGGCAIDTDLGSTHRSCAGGLNCQTPVRRLRRCRAPDGRQGRAARRVWCRSTTAVSWGDTMGITRRDTLKFGGLAAVGAAGLTLPLGRSVAADTPSLLPSSKFPKVFAAPLVQPPLLQPVSVSRDA